MYGYPLLTFDSALSNFNGFNFIHTTACSQGWTLTRLTYQHKKLAGIYWSVVYGRHATSWSKTTSMASLLIRSVQPLLSRAWAMHSGVNLSRFGLVLLTQKCGDVINTQQARRSKWNKTRDLLGFNIEPADSKNSSMCQSIWPAIDKERKSYQ